MSYTVIVGDVPVMCDTVQEVLELVAHVHVQHAEPPPAAAEPPAPPETQAPAADGTTSRWYRCRRCGHERLITANFKRFPTKTMSCDRTNCTGDCERFTPDTPGDRAETAADPD